MARASRLPSGRSTRKGSRTLDRRRRWSNGTPTCRRSRCCSRRRRGLLRYWRRSSVSPAAPAVLELQRAVCRGIVARDDGDAAACIIADGIDPAARLGIHRNTFASVLTNSLRLSYPAVHRLVAAECFEGAARVYIEEQPPRCANLDDYGADFPEFLARFPPVAAVASLPPV